LIIRFILITRSISYQSCLHAVLRLPCTGSRRRCSGPQVARIQLHPASTRPRLSRELPRTLCAGLRLAGRQAGFGVMTAPALTRIGAKLIRAANAGLSTLQHLWAPAPGRNARRSWHLPLSRSRPRTVPAWPTREPTGSCCIWKRAATMAASCCLAAKVSRRSTLRLQLLFAARGRTIGGLAPAWSHSAGVGRPAPDQASLTELGVAGQRRPTLAFIALLGLSAFVDLWIKHSSIVSACRPAAPVHRWPAAKAWATGRPCPTPSGQHSAAALLRVP
jgi:hypothetical protein